MSRLVFIFLLTIYASAASAQQIEIIHTNDLHSHFETGDESGHGGYAAVKATIDRLKAQAQAAGIETLTLDAGDFSEGTLFYIADSGEDSWRVVQQMGYDAIAIGNHDWLVGPAEMDAIVAAVQPQTPLLSANIDFDARFHALNQYIRPHAEFTRAGVRIGVMGLATDEIEYSWRITDGKINPPNDVGKKEVEELRLRNDIVIALTHLGVTADQALAANVPGIDLIVGGHSHTVLADPVWVKDPHGREVPIVQTGAHGQYVGDLLIDYEPGKPLKIVHYRLIPVLKTAGQDPAMLEQVAAVRRDLEKKYTAQWLYEVIGTSETAWESPQDYPTPWGNFYVDAIREAAGADLGLDDSEFFGDNQPAGAITREQVMNFYPRFFDVDRPLGWNVWTVQVPGWILDAVLRVATSEGTFFDLSNCDIDFKGTDVAGIRIGGEPLDLVREYRVAVSEGIGLGADDIQWLLKLIFQPHDTGIPIWTAVERKIRASSSLSSNSPGTPGAPGILPSVHLQSITNALPASRRWKPGKVANHLFRAFSANP
jgi:2',3'-cyclic-nucleotide 2'-phosphodiesterase (5'-nucleotidase family)